MQLCLENQRQIHKVRGIRVGQSWGIENIEKLSGSICIATKENFNFNSKRKLNRSLHCRLSIPKTIVSLKINE